RCDLTQARWQGGAGGDGAGVRGGVPRWQAVGLRRRGRRPHRAHAGGGAALAGAAGRADRAMTVPVVDLAALIRPSKAEYLAAFERVLDTGGFVGGPAVAELEAGFAAYCGVPHAIAVRTGTDALMLALRALGVGAGDEVITAANSFFATAEAISHAGATPVLADVDDQALLLDPADVARRVTPRTRRLIALHPFRHAPDIAALAP